MRILFIQKHFWPDVGAPAHQARAVASRLQYEGHSVAVLTAMPAYNDAYAGPPPRRREELDGVEVIRMRSPRERKGTIFGRVLGAAPFLVGTATHLLAPRRRYDLVVVSSVPPVLLASVVRIVTRVRGWRYVYHLQDINPEAALAGGVISPGWWSHLLYRLDVRNCRKAVALVVLSDDMRSSVMSRGQNGDRISVINNFVTFAVDELALLPEGLEKDEAKFRVLFAGNLGLLQDLESLVGAARILKDSKVEFLFMGGGLAEGLLQNAQKELGEESFRVVPYQPLPIALRVMCEADLGVVSLGPEIHRYAFPSKLMAYLTAGCPVVVVADQSSALVSFVKKTGVGSTVSPNRPRELASAIKQLQTGPERQDRQSIADVARANFGKEPALHAWSDLISSLVG